MTKSTSNNNISGVFVIPSITWSDDRGYFRELWRTDRKEMPRQIAQTSVTMTLPGVIKAFHGHDHQDDCWYVAQGRARVVLVDRRKRSATSGQTQTIYCGEDAPAMIVIPRGVFHGYQVLGHTPVLLMYHTTQMYESAHPDELRIPFDDPTIGYDWTIKNR